MTNQAPPSQWPPEVVAKYDTVRSLGKGGFASVVLAQRKDDPNSLAAIKVVGSSPDKFSKQEYGYAHREIDILKELSHPNIMRVLDYWEPQGKVSSLVVMALTYSQGPTLDQLLKYGGAVGMTFGRVVMAQLVDALAYCHSRAVIHRDVKPDNVIVTGANPSQQDLWVDSVGGSNEKSPEEWKELCQKWHVTLIDFGFARALSPEDIEMEKVAAKKASNDTNPSQSVHSVGSSRRSRRSLDKSISHALTRQMSALGNRLYAAPEIVQGVHSRHSLVGNSQHNATTSRHMEQVDITKTISQHVANYGMLVDAFSLGNTLQYMMTGVPPNQNVNQTVANHRSPVAALFRWISQHACAKSNNDPAKRDYQYRSWSDLPKEAMRLIRALNHPSVTQRISVRATRRYPLIESVLDDTATQEQEEAAHHRVHFLDCALKRQAKNQKEAAASVAAAAEIKAAITADESSGQSASEDLPEAHAIKEEADSAIMC